MIAAYRKLKYDKEVYFSAAILHDIGLTESRLSPLTQCCFAVSGGHQAHDFLLSKDHPAAKAQIVGDAISAHLNLHLPVRKYGEVASLVAKGAVCDLFGFEKRKLPEKFKSDLLRAYPAGDLQAALLSNEEMAPGSRLENIRRPTSGRSHVHYGVGENKASSRILGQTRILHRPTPSTAAIFTPTFGRDPSEGALGKLNGLGTGRTGCLYSLGTCTNSSLSTT